ncbi:MAG: hypothetical protein SCJ97_10220 [Bacillota bacterium]|nr:hypothetical protein [Bacillota bacterium]
MWKTRLTFFRVEFNQGEETLIEVDNDAEWDAVAATWQDRVQQMDFGDDLEDDEDYL